MHNVRARPTLRVLQEDLTSDWQSPRVRRALDRDRLHDLHPVSELDHPIVTKAVASFGADPADDNFVGPIASATKIRLLEIKNSQWRGGVWTDPGSGVRWLVVAGLAKGGHEDRDDFYERVARADKSEEMSRWLPESSDERLLRQETAARLRTEWQLDVQRQVRDALAKVAVGGSVRCAVPHPVASQGVLAEIDLSVVRVREDDYRADEVAVELLTQKQYAGSDIAWDLIMRVLISISPPEQGWDRYGDVYSNIAEVDGFATRVTELDALIDAHELAESVPGTSSHYVHEKHLAGSTVEGKAVRALCGAYFVSCRIPDDLPRCPECERLMAELPE